MAGIYIHIPFCRKACSYCDFHFSTSLQNKHAFLQALKKEIVLQKDYLGTKKISTLYFGGGTPSLLEQGELLDIFETLHMYFEIDKDAEITLEANPDDLTAAKVSELRSTPVNRFSIGIQSFYDEDLQLMNRAHTAAEAAAAVKHARDKGFENITIDLIYGIPTLTDEKWRSNLEQAFALGISHISAYCLTVEPGTALAHAVKTGKIKDVDEEQSARQFEIMLESMTGNGFVQYEISNFCRDGCYSRHNSNYWLKENYLGLGPSAHSYNGISRQWNVSGNSRYIRSLENNRLDIESETLAAAQRYNEYVLTSLRTIWGTSLERIGKEYGKAYAACCLGAAQKYIASADVVFRENQLFLTDKGKLVADKIAADLFMVE